MFLLLFNPIVENIFCFSIFFRQLHDIPRRPLLICHIRLDLFLFQLIMLRRLWEWNLFVHRFEREILLQKGMKWIPSWTTKLNIFSIASKMTDLKSIGTVMLRSKGFESITSRIIKFQSIPITQLPKKKENSIRSRSDIQFFTKFQNENETFPITFHVQSQLCLENAWITLINWELFIYSFKSFMCRILHCVNWDRFFLNFRFLSYYSNAWEKIGQIRFYLPNELFQREFGLLQIGKNPRWIDLILNGVEIGKLIRIFRAYTIAYTDKTALDALESQSNLMIMVGIVNKQGIFCWMKKSTTTTKSWSTKR